MCNNVQRSEEGIGSLGTTVTGIYELPYECWVLNLGLLQKHSISQSFAPLCDALSGFLGQILFVFLTLKS